MKTLKIRGHHLEALLKSQNPDAVKKTLLENGYITCENEIAYVKHFQNLTDLLTKQDISVKIVRGYDSFCDGCLRKSKRHCLSKTLAKRDKKELASWGNGLKVGQPVSAEEFVEAIHLDYAIYENLDLYNGIQTYVSILKKIGVQGADKLLSTYSEYWQKKSHG